MRIKNQIYQFLHFSYVGLFNMNKSHFKKILLELLDNNEAGITQFKRFFKHIWYLVDGDGYTVILLYQPDLCLFYENRNLGTFHIDVIDPMNFSKDVNDFIHEIENEFNESLSPYQNQMVEEIERVILLYNNQLN